MPTLFCQAEGHAEGGDRREPPEDPAQSKTPRMSIDSMRENREAPVGPAVQAVGRTGKAAGPKPEPETAGESDRGIVPENPPNEAAVAAEEAGEGRPRAKENAAAPHTGWTQSQGAVSQGLAGVRQAASQDPRRQFTALLHHLTPALLEDSFDRLQRQAAPGVDGVTWKEYEKGLRERLVDLHARVHRGGYRAQPSKRTYIPKADGKKRPLGIAALEDKIVQQAVVTILDQIYEEDFLGFSYGFRPRRGAHDALDAWTVGICRRRVIGGLDADIRGFFDNLKHEWLMEFLQHRVRDPRILRLIEKWLKAGVSEEGEWKATTVGTPQGAVISPLLANIYLHYVVDLWVAAWRKKQARGNVAVVRYADDLVFGFEHRDDAERFLEQLRERLAKFGLELHPDKTRLIAFGRDAERNGHEGKGSKPGTFDFLGFTHFCGRNRKTGYFTVRRKTTGKRLRAKLKQVGTALRTRMHEQVEATGKWLRAVVQGYLNYHAVPENRAALETFRTGVIRHWYRALRRRGQRRRLTWATFRPYIRRWIPSVRILHPYPSERFAVKHPRWEPYAVVPHVRFCAGGAG